MPCECVHVLYNIYIYTYMYIFYLRLKWFSMNTWAMNVNNECLCLHKADKIQLSSIHICSVYDCYIIPSTKCWLIAVVLLLHLQGYSLSSHLTDEQRAEMKAYISLVENVFVNAVVWSYSSSARWYCYCPR